MIKINKKIIWSIFFFSSLFCISNEKDVIYNPNENIKSYNCSVIAPSIYPNQNRQISYRKPVNISGHPATIGFVDSPFFPCNDDKYKTFLTEGTDRASLFSESNHENKTNSTGSGSDDSIFVSNYIHISSLYKFDDIDLNQKIINTDYVLNKKIIERDVFGILFYKVNKARKAFLTFVQNNSRDILELRTCYLKRIEILKQLQLLVKFSSQDQIQIQDYISYLSEERKNINILDFILYNKTSIKEEEIKIHDILNSIKTSVDIHNLIRKYNDIPVKTYFLTESLYEGSKDFFAKHFNGSRYYKRVFKEFFDAKDELEEQIRKSWREERLVDESLLDLHFTYNPFDNYLTASIKS